MATGFIYFYQNWKDWESSGVVGGEESLTGLFREKTCQP
jgi:hypothetical protein